MKLFLDMLKTSRIKQQTKNLLILVPIFLSLNYWWGETVNEKTTLLLEPNNAIPETSAAMEIRNVNSP